MTGIIETIRMDGKLLGKKSLGKLYPDGLDNGFEFDIIPITDGNPGAGIAIYTEGYWSLDPMIKGRWYTFHILPTPGRAFISPARSICIDSHYRRTVL